MGAKLLENRTAIVTGAGAGIGRAIANRLSAWGARVIINDIDEVLVRETEAAISKAGGDVAVVIGNVANPETAKEMMKAASDRWGGLDILVNSASVTRDAMIHLLPNEWFSLMMEVTVKGTFMCIRAAAPLMCSNENARAPADKRVHRKIVNIASTAGIYGAAGKIAYAAATAAIIGMTKTVAREWAPFFVNCNAVAPGLISPRPEIGHRTNVDDAHMQMDAPTQETTQEYGFESLSPNFAPMSSGRKGTPEETAFAATEGVNKAAWPMPLGRIGTPDDVAGAVAFLAGPDSDFITGTVLEVHGGAEIISGHH